MALEDVLEGFALFFKVIYFWIVDSIKALLPLGVLPRKDVRGQTVLITGAGSGLGRLLAKEFAKLDTKVILWDVNEAGNLETKKFVEELGAEAHVYTVDLSDRKAINKVAEAVKKDHGGVDILINNAGIVTGKKIFDCPDELMEKTMFVNGHAPLFTTKQFLPGMLERDRGHLVTIASMAGLAGTAGLVDYCASKHAAVGYARSLAAELRKLGKSDTIHTTTICPFYIDTGMFEGVQLKFPMVLLKPEYVVDNILEAVLTNKEIIQLPKTMYINTYLSSFLPSRVLHILAEHAGVNDSMETFVGRNKRD